MIYLFSSPMNKNLQILRPAVILGIGLALALTGASLGPTGSRADLGTATLYQAATATPTTEAVSRAGSTDGIVLMGVIIVAVILLPLIFRKSIWTK